MTFENNVDRKFLRQRNILDRSNNQQIEYKLTAAGNPGRLQGSQGSASNPGPTGSSESDGAASQPGGIMRPLIKHDGGANRSSVSCKKSVLMLSQHMPFTSAAPYPSKVCPLSTNLLTAPAPAQDLHLHSFLLCIYRSCFHQGHLSNCNDSQTQKSSNVSTLSYAPTKFYACKL